MWGKASWIMCYLQSSILFLLPESLCHLYRLGNRMGLKPTAQDTSFSSPQVLVTTPSSTGGNSLLAYYTVCCPALNRHSHTSGCPCQNRSPAPWCIMRGLCSQPRLLVDGTNANWEYLGPTLPLLYGLEDVSRNNLDMVS